MNNIFFENDRKTSRQILNINWATCSLGYFLVLLTKIFGLARISYFYLFFCFSISIILLVVAEVFYNFVIVHNNRSKISLKYFIVFITCIAPILILSVERNPYVIAVWLYGITAAALYYDVKLFLFSCGISIFLVIIVVSNNMIELNRKTYSSSFIIDLFRSSIISIVLLAGYLKKSKGIILTIKKQEEQLANLNQSLEAKVNERTSELQEANDELNAQQEELLDLNTLLEAKIDERTSELRKFKQGAEFASRRTYFAKQNIV